MLFDPYPFIDKVLAALGDPDPKLVYSEYLADHGFPMRSKFVEYLGRTGRFPKCGRLYSDNRGEIVRRARQEWEKENRPFGRDKIHWTTAEYNYYTTIHEDGIFWFDRLATNSFWRLPVVFSHWFNHYDNPTVFVNWEALEKKGAEAWQYLTVKKKFLGLIPRPWAPDYGYVGPGENGDRLARIQSYCEGVK